MDTGLPIIVITTHGAKSGKVRKTPVMRVEHGGEYTLVASKGGAPEHPEWFYNLEAHPDEVLVREGPAPFAVRVREVSGDEKAAWWKPGRGDLSALRRVPGKDGPADPRVRHHAEGRLNPAAQHSAGRRRRRPAPRRSATGRGSARGRAGSCRGARPGGRAEGGRVMDWPWSPEQREVGCELLTAPRPAQSAPYGLASSGSWATPRCGA